MKPGEVAKHAAVAAGEALLLVAATTVVHHREKTHQSLELDEPLERVALTAMKVTGVNTDVWAAVHTVHHGVTDANFVPIIELADYLRQRREHPKPDAPSIPEVFTGLDPDAHLSAREVEEIADLARVKVEGKYKVPDSYTREDEVRLLDPVTPRFYYPEKPSLLQRLRKKGDQPEDQNPQADIYRLAPLLQDPHSPPFHRNKVRGVSFDNVWLYKRAAKYFALQENRPAHLKESGDVEGKQPSPKWIVGFFAGNILLAGLIRGGWKPRDLAGHIAVGAATAEAVYEGYKTGGNVTNGFGHGGVHPILAFFFKRMFKMFPDGTYASNAKTLGPLTLDEVGGQKVHHEDPGRIAYTRNKGLRGFADAPFGTLLSMLARHGIGMKPGPGFDLKPGELRPDVPSEAVLMLRAARVRTLQAKEAVAQAAASLGQSTQAA